MKPHMVPNFAAQIWCPISARGESQLAILVASRAVKSSSETVTFRPFSGLVWGGGYKKLQTVETVQLFLTELGTQKGLRLSQQLQYYKCPAL